MNTLNEETNAVNAITRLVNEIECILADNNVPRLNLEIRCVGRVGSGEIKMEYAIVEPADINWVKGSTPSAVVYEMLRRRGWQVVNAPKCLPRPSDRLTQDDIDHIEDNIAPTFIPDVEDIPY